MTDNTTSFLVIDTEGSGLFRYKDETGKPVPADAPGQPRLASLAMIRVNAAFEVESLYHAYVKPDGWVMDPGATKVNGLTDEFLAANGKPVREVLDMYVAAVKEGRTVVAHNAQHDAKQIRGELRRAGLPDMFEETPNICTMRMLTDVCKIPPKGGRGGYKWPALSEACVFFHFDEFGDHSAANDAMQCYRLLLELHKLGKPLGGAVHPAKVAPAGKSDLREQLEASVKATQRDSDQAW